MLHRRWSVPLLLVVGAVGLLLPLPTVLRAAAAVVLAYGFFRMGYAMIRGLGTPLPGPPPEGELRRVNLRYRCSSCGVELRLTRAANAEPEAPRHCMDEMDLVAAADA